MGALVLSSINGSVKDGQYFLHMDSTLLSFCLALSGVRFIFLVMGMFLNMTCGRC